MSDTTADVVVEDDDDYVLDDDEEPVRPAQMCPACQSEMRPDRDNKVAYRYTEPHPDCLVCGGTGDPYKFN